MSIEALLALFDEPTLAGRRASSIRDEAFGPCIWIREAAPVTVPEVATILRDEAFLPLQTWPSAADLRPGDTLLLDVSVGTKGRERFADWLLEHAPRLPADVAVAPSSRESAGLHRLWSIAAARIVLPPTVRVQARHDLIGIRLSQIALGFGADTLAGPLAPERKLPVAGVTRPNENTRSGLATLVAQAGLRSIDDPVAGRPTAPHFPPEAP